MVSWTSVEKLRGLADVPQRGGRPADLDGGLALDLLQALATKCGSRNVLTPSRARLTTSSKRGITGSNVELVG